jgi:hypothetical protein
MALTLPPTDYNCSIAVFAGILEFDFARVPDTLVVDELFALERQDPSVKVLSPVQLDDEPEPERIRRSYSLQFPRTYEPISLALALAQGLRIDHGYSVRIVRSGESEDDEDFDEVRV